MVIFGVTPEYVEVRQREIPAARIFDAADLGGIGIMNIMLVSVSVMLAVAFASLPSA